MRWFENNERNICHEYEEVKPFCVMGKRETHVSVMLASEITLVVKRNA